MCAPKRSFAWGGGETLSGKVPVENGSLFAGASLRQVKNMTSKKYHSQNYSFQWKWKSDLYNERQIRGFDFCRHLLAVRQDMLSALFILPLQRPHVQFWCTRIYCIMLPVNQNARLSIVESEDTLPWEWITCVCFCPEFIFLLCMDLKVGTQTRCLFENLWKWKNNTPAQLLTCSWMI